jgi:hypothetical protein
MKEKDEIEELFSSTFEDFSVEPPAEFKNSLDKKLFNKKSRYGFWILGSILLLGLISGLFLFNHSTSKTLKTTSNNSDVATPYSSELTSNHSVNKQNHTSKSITSQLKQKVELSNQPQIKSLEAELKNEKKDITENSIIRSKKDISTNKLTVKNKSTKVKSRRFNDKDKIDNKFEDNQTSIDVISNSTLKNGIIDNSITNNIPKEEINQSKSINETDLSKSNDIEQKAKNDSLATSDKSVEETKNVEQVAVAADTNVIQEVKDPISNWLISARFGSGVGFNSFKNQNIYDVNEKNTIFFNVELTKMLNSKYSFTSGIHFDQNESLLSYKYEKVETSFIGFDTTYIPILDSNGATIGYNQELNPKYENTSSTNVLQNRYSVTGITLPIYLGFSTKLNNNFYLDLNTGLLIGYQQAKLLSGTSNINDPKLNHFGMKVCLRPQVRYQFKKIGVSLNTSIGYDIIPAMNWSGVKRSRIYSNFGVGFHYSF